MQQFKSLNLCLVLALLAAILPGPALSQSGRGRPTVKPPTSTATTPAEPVAVPAASAVVNQEQAGALSRFTLKNGITVIINEQFATPIVASVAYFKAGRDMETAASSGTLRLLERMMFRGTKTRAAGRTEADVRALGGLIGAETTAAGTAYALVSPPDRLKDALAIQADLIQNPLLDPADMSRQIQLLIEEEKARSNPEDYSMERLLGFASSDKLVARAQSFNRDDLRSITRDQLVEYYRKLYRPENMVVVVVGSAPLYNTLVQIQQLYGAFGKGAAASSPSTMPTGARAPGAGQKPDLTAQAKQEKTSPANKKPASADRPPDSQASATTAAQPPDQNKPPSEQSTVEQAQPQLRYVIDRGDINQAVVTVAFPAAATESKEQAAMEVLAAVLGRGRASRLNRLLVEAQMAASSVDSNYLALGRAGLLSIQIRAATGSIDKAESALFRELDGLRRTLLADVELRRAKVTLEKRFVDINGPYLSRALALARAESDSGSFRAWVDYRKRIGAVTAEEVQSAAAKYLTLQNTAVHEYLPASAEPRTFDQASFTTTVRSWASGFAQPVDSKTIRAAEADPAITVISQNTDRDPNEQAMMESVQPLPVKDFSTLNGPRAFVREDHSQPRITISLLFQGGRILEDENTSGITELMLRSILGGTPRRTSTQIANEFDQLGADVQLVTEQDFFGFNLSVLARNADRALKVLRDVIEEPALRDEDINRARIAQAGAIATEKDSARSHSRQLLYQALFPGHSYSLPPHGREEAISKLTSQQLHDWHEQSIKRQIPIAIIIGDTNGSALVSGQLAEGFRRRDVDSSLKVKVPQPSTPSEKVESRRLETSASTIGFAGPKADSDDALVLELIEAWMNGRGGRLSGELREKQGLVIESSINSEAMFLAGAVYAELITTPENEARARAALMAELERVARAGLSADEVAAARACLNSSTLAALQGQEMRAIEYARAIVYKREPATVDEINDRLSKLTAEDVKRTASVYLKPALASAGIVRGTLSTSTSK